MPPVQPRTLLSPLPQGPHSQGVCGLPTGLIRAALFVAAFEALKVALVDFVRRNFGSPVGSPCDEKDPKYRADVRRLGGDETTICLACLQNQCVLTAVDIEAYRRLMECRNGLVHELVEGLGPKGFPPDYEERFDEMLSLMRKIEIWFVRQLVERDGLPLKAGGEIPDQNIIPGHVNFVGVLRSIALETE